jgi:ParB family transcriptional regulator, chromosome partitioning protein
MTKTKALGRGLGNLIGGNKTSAGPNMDMDTLQNLKNIQISEIVLNPSQPRKTFSEQSISELAETIRLHGVIQPIVVIKRENGYELVSGERRLRACQQVGLVRIPAVVKNYSPEEALEIAIIENIQREDLNPIEEAMAYQELINKLSLKVTDIAARVGKNRTTISNLIRLLNLPDEIKTLVKEGKISEGHARPLLSIGDKTKMKSIANMIIEKGMTVREVEEMVNSLLDSDSLKVKLDRKRDPSIVHTESKIRNKLLTKVNLSHNEKTGKGKIVINYSNIDEMERIIKIFGI